jgi:hypothetical protein
MNEADTYSIITFGSKIYDKPKMVSANKKNKEESLEFLEKLESVDELESYYTQAFQTAFFVLLDSIINLDAGAGCENNILLFTHAAQSTPT